MLLPEVWRKEPGRLKFWIRPIGDAGAATSWRRESPALGGYARGPRDGTEYPGKEAEAKDHGQDDQQPIDVRWHGHILALAHLTY